MRPKLIALLVLFVVAPSGCEHSTTAPNPALTPSLDVLNGPDTLPNIFRVAEHYYVTVGDPETDLVAAAGLPHPPSSFIGCQVYPGFTGTNELQLSPIQDVGQMRDAINRLINDGDVSLHVYKRSTFIGVCRSTVIAAGNGRLTNTDNDLTFSQTRTNTWGWHMTGKVTVFATGETKELNAQNRWVVNPVTGVGGLIFRRVDLH